MSHTVCAFVEFAETLYIARAIICFVTLSVLVPCFSTLRAHVLIVFRLCMNMCDPHRVCLLVFKVVYLFYLLLSLHVLQQVALNMSTICCHNESSMLLLHLPWMDLSSWGQELKQHNFTFVKAPLVIGSKPTGYSASWSHKPLSCTQTFFMFKQRAAQRPFHNAWKMFNANKKSNWRELWSDLVMIKPSEYNKESKEEIQKKVNLPPVQRLRTH